MKPRTIQGPVLADAPVGRRGRSLWKRVLPEGEIVYRDKEGKKRVINMNAQYHSDLIASYGAGALDTTPLMFADKDNAHTMAPERWRGKVTATKFARSGDELEPGVAADEPGLYTKVEFGRRRDAKLAIKSGLGVSARIREGIETANGREFPRAMIHVLGTFDPKITGLGDWKPGVDLSNYASEDVLDLSGAEIRMPKLRRKPKAEPAGDLNFATMTETEIAAIDPDSIEGWSDEQLTEFMARVAELTSDDVDDAEDEGDDDAEDEGDESDDADDDEDDPEPEPVKGKTKKDTKMSNRSGRDQIDLAVTRSQQASDTAAEALRRAGKAEWDAEKAKLLRAGVPPAALDLAQPVLSRVEDAVNIDFSNTATGGEKVDVTKIVRGLIDQLKGTIEFDEHGVDLANEDDDPDKELNDLFDRDFGHLGI